MQCEIIALVYDDAGDVLIIQTDGEKSWRLPSGRTDPAEGVWAGVRRVALKMTGLVIEPKRILAIEIDASDGTASFGISGKLVGGSLGSVRGRERLDWVTRREAARKIDPSTMRLQVRELFP